MKKAILNGYALNGYTVHSNLPIGAPMPWLSDNLPVGFLAFDGSEYNIADYPELYNVVKNIPSFHSETEGKFKIPNLKGRVLQGADTVIGELIEAGLPNIEGNTGIHASGSTSEGCFYNDVADGSAVAQSQGNYAKVLFDASKSNPIYGNSDTVQTNAFTVRWIIKATQYATVEQNAIDDTKFTTGNVLSAQKIAQYINDQNELSDIETISISATPTIMNYDGVIYATQDGSGNHSIYVNDVLLYISVNFDCILIKKGDAVRVSGNSINNIKARFYKKRDYSQR